MRGAVLRRTTAVFVAGAGAFGTLGAAQAMPLEVQRALTTTGMNEQTTSYENAVGGAVAERFAPFSAATSGEPRNTRVWWQNDLRHLDFSGTSVYGTSGSILVGVDLLASEDAAIGFFGGYSETDSDSDVLGLYGQFEAQSFGGGFYAGYRLAPGIAVDAFVAYTYTDTDYIQGRQTGSGDSDRLTAGVGLSAAYMLGGITFAPRASVSITQDWHEGYSDQFGTPIGSNDSTLFRGYLGGRAGTTFDLGGTGMDGWLAAGVEFTADDAGAVSRVDDGASGRFGLGLSVPLGAARFSLEANTSGIGANDYVDFGGTMTLSYAFN